MRPVGRGDHDQVDSPVEQLIHAANECDIGIARVWRATALHDGRKAETLDHTNHRCVEYLAREAETDQSDIEHEGDCTRTAQLRHGSRSTGSSSTRLSCRTGW